jgi:hypothetical protein
MLVLVAKTASSSASVRLSFRKGPVIYSAQDNSSPTAVEV